MNWIMSEGGPLVCLEKALEETWGGVDKLTVADAAATCDYDRACATNAYLNLVPLTQSAALAIGEGPMYTYVWRSPFNIVFIVQTFYAESDGDDEQKLRKLNDSMFDEPHQLTQWRAETSEMVIFDAAMPGSEPDKESLVFNLRPGRYQIRTKVYNPDTENSFLLHRFDHMD